MRIPLLLLAVTAVLLPLNGLRPIEGATYADIGLVIVGLASILRFPYARLPHLLIVVLLGMLLILVGGAFGMVASQDWGGTVQMAKFLIGAPMVLLIVALVSPSRNEAKLLLTAYAVGGVITSVAALYMPVDPAFGRARGYGVHIGHLALAGQLAAFVWIGWVIEAKFLILKVGAGIAAGLCLWGMLLSGTRSAMASTVIGLIILAISYRGRGVAVLSSLGALAVFAIITNSGHLPMGLDRAFGQATTIESDSAHGHALRNAFFAVGEHPFAGWGFGPAQEAHNLILQVAQLGGIVALIGFLLMWIPIGLTILQRLNLGAPPRDGVAAATLCAIPAYWLFAQFEPLIWDRHLWFYLVVALLLQRSAGGVDAPDQPVEVELVPEPTVRG